MKDMVKGIQQKIDQIEAEISKLYGNRKVLLESIEIFGGAESNILSEVFTGKSTSNIVNVKAPKVNVKGKVQQVKSDKTGKVKFLRYIRGIFESRPDETFAIGDIRPIVQRAIDNGTISLGSKKFNDAISSSICSLATRGILKKSKHPDGNNIYVFNGIPKSRKQKKEETQVSSFNNNLL